MDAELEKKISEYMSKLGKMGAAAKTPEQRSAASKKGWAKRKANK